ncbi:MAG: protease inhibitor I42 family protein [Microthrixaceae bacterium]|nr:protease inhibitor I42 family protein [Microthrixaceae bacterium]
MGESKRPTLTGDDTDRTVTLTPGDEFDVELRENATTGFRWSIEELPAALELVEERFIAPPEPTPGAAGGRAWRFRALAAGNARLDFRYLQPWEGTSSMADQASFAIEVVDHQT